MPSTPKNHLPTHSPFGIRLNLPFDLDALTRHDIQLSNNQSLQGQTTGVSLSEGKASKEHRAALADPNMRFVLEEGLSQATCLSHRHLPLP